MAPRTAEQRERSAYEARIRQIDGDRLTQLQTKDLAWLEKRQREQIAEETLAAIPKGTYCQLAGRQHSVIDKMARHYQLDALLGDTVDLYEAVAQLHDLIASNARLIQPLRRGEIDDDSDVGDLDEDSEEVYRLQIRKLQETIRKLNIANERAKIGLAKDRGDAIDRGEVRAMFEILTARLQAFGQQVRRAKSGPEAQQSLNEFLDHLAAEIEAGELQV